MIEGIALSILMILQGFNKINLPIEYLKYYLGVSIVIWLIYIFNPNKYVENNGLGIIDKILFVSVIMLQYGGVFHFPEVIMLLFIIRGVISIFASFM